MCKKNLSLREELRRLGGQLQLRQKCRGARQLFLATGCRRCGRLYLRGVSLRQTRTFSNSRSKRSLKRSKCMTIRIKSSLTHKSSLFNSNIRNLKLPTRCPSSLRLLVNLLLMLRRNPSHLKACRKMTLITNLRCSKTWE